MTCGCGGSDGTRCGDALTPLDARRVRQIVNTPQARDYLRGEVTANGLVAQLTAIGNKINEHSDALTEFVAKVGRPAVALACDGDNLIATITHVAAVTVTDVSGVLIEGIMSLVDSYSIDGDGTKSVAITWPTTFSDEKMSLSITCNDGFQESVYEFDDVSGCQEQTTPAVWKTPGTNVFVYLNLAFSGGNGANGSRQMSFLSELRVHNFSPCPGVSGPLRPYIDTGSTAEASKSFFRFRVYDAWAAGVFDFSRPITFVMRGGVTETRSATASVSTITTPSDSGASDPNVKDFQSIAGGNCQNVLDLFAITIDTDGTILSIESL